ncbi:hemoglobin subunit alpha-5-like [Pelobates fuscus]|uniref:hemoglobin subunit alpha-5-like n=1 Tax=Pelobates fuscus TaxID=191477 RepID=UPI002FE47BDD
MTFSGAEKAAIAYIWGKVAGQTDELGAEALERQFLSYPQTKTYYSKYNMSHGSPDLLSQGGKLMNFIGKAASQLDDLKGALSPIIDLHANQLRVNPGDYTILWCAIQVTLAAHFGSEFSPTVYAAWDKFLNAISAVMTSTY